MTQGIQRCWTVRNSEIVDVDAVAGAGRGDAVAEELVIVLIPGLEKVAGEQRGADGVEHRSTEAEWKRSLCQ